MQTVNVGVTKLAYHEQGDGSPVLFIHGTGTYSETFQPVLDELDDSVRAIVYDRRGFGASSARVARRLSEHVDDAAALLETLNAAPATIFGSSLGGVLALRLAATRPDLISALVLVEPAYQMALVPSLSASTALTRVALRWSLRRDPESAALHFYQWATGYASGGNQFDSYPENWKRTAIGHAHATLAELLQATEPRPRRSALREIACPTAVIIGDAGRPVFHRTANRALKTIPSARPVPAPGAAHLVYTDQPTICARAILDAVRGARRVQR